MTSIAIKRQRTGEPLTGCSKGGHWKGPINRSDVESSSVDCVTLPAIRLVAKVGNAGPSLQCPRECEGTLFSKRDSFSGKHPKDRRNTRHTSRPELPRERRR